MEDIWMRTTADKAFLIHLCCSPRWCHAFWVPEPDSQNKEYMRCEKDARREVGRREDVPCVLDPEEEREPESFKGKLAIPM